MVFKKGEPRPENAGRKKGIANKLTEDYKQLIADSSPVEFLISAFTNGYIKGNVENDEDQEKFLTLTLKERCDIAKDLTKKIVPDLKAIEHTGKDGEELITTDVTNVILAQLSTEKIEEILNSGTNNENLN